MTDLVVHTQADVSLQTENDPENLVLGSTGPTSSSANISGLVPQVVYDGGFPDAKTVRLRISNGGAGQVGLIGSWANAFIQDQVAKGSEPFKVEWYLGDTTQSLQYVAAKYVDVAFTYNKAAELALVRRGAVSERVLIFYDHFLLAGPNSNPANLSPENDSVADMFNKIVAAGNTDVALPPDPAVRPPTRFLSRFDKSATNIKESEQFIAIGQVPWALAYSSWYHQYPMFPAQALQAASALSEYTLSDRGSWLSSPDEVTKAMTVFKQGSDDAPELYSQCHALVSTEPGDKVLVKEFMQWLLTVDGGQKIVREFERRGEPLYAPAVTN
ncbi:hypothetical protein EUX98_g7010 [Antrodiella citrinella]|uniref:PBP domain-containing protein n=1 Tax=Antrodiella citrinella TaxID=2447956 RepID=A0A4V3XI25_9APHY|nr:hypothetical protein EUX98_g7010 [Antrodiella citrinella]